MPGNVLTLPCGIARWHLPSLTPGNGRSPRRTGSRATATERSPCTKGGRRTPVLTVLKAALLAGLFFCLVSCASDRKDGVVVSGKTVYRGMGIEEVVIQVLRSEKQSWVPCGTAKSGYHGSFMVRLAAGRYLLQAHTVLPSAAGRKDEIRGMADVTVGRSRVDRIVIQLTDA